MLLEKNVVNKILDIQKLNPEDKGHVFAMLDAFLQLDQKLTMQTFSAL